MASRTIAPAASGDVLPLGGQQEAHGRPGDDAKAAAVEQVDDDRDRNRAGRPAPPSTGLKKNKGEQGWHWRWADAQFSFPCQAMRQIARQRNAQVGVRPQLHVVDVLLSTAPLQFGDESCASGRDSRGEASAGRSAVPDTVPGRETASLPGTETPARRASSTCRTMTSCRLCRRCFNPRAAPALVEQVAEDDDDAAAVIRSARSWKIGPSWFSPSPLPWFKT